MRGKRVLPRVHGIAVFGMLLILSACSHKKEGSQHSMSSPVSVDGLQLQEVPFINTYVASGTVVANEFVELHPEVAGRITSLNIPEGRMVQAGTLLATLFNDDLKAQLSKTQAQLALAQQTEQRMKTLLDAQGTSQQEYDNAVNQVNSLQADEAVLNAQIRKTEIVAPFSGVVGLRNVSPGAYVSPQDVITTIQEPGHLRVDFTLPEEEGNLVHTHEIVEVASEGSDSTQPAEIIAIEPQVDVATRNLKIRAEFKKSNPGLNAGAFVRVMIDENKNARSLMIPSNAIIPDSRGSLVVFVKDGKADFRIVQTGGRTSSWVEISQGASAGDTVAISGIMYLKPHAPVHMQSMKTYEQLGYSPTNH